MFILSQRLPALLGDTSILDEDAQLLVELETYVSAIAEAEAEQVARDRARQGREDRGSARRGPFRRRRR